jgi:hypothetical protein
MAGSPDTEPSQHFELLPTFRSALACSDFTTNNSETLRQIILKATAYGSCVIIQLSFSDETSESIAGIWPSLYRIVAYPYNTDDPNNPDSLYQDTSIQALQHRGAKRLSCHTATEEQVRTLMRHNNLAQQPEMIVKEMLAHTLPEVLVVPSMVAAIALLQTDGHYSYITV